MASHYYCDSIFETQEVVNCTQCALGYTGDECSINVMERDYFFITLLLLYQVVHMVGSLLMLGWIVFGLFVKLKERGVDWHRVYCVVGYINAMFCIVRYVWKFFFGYFLSVLMVFNFVGVVIFY